MSLNLYVITFGVGVSSPSAFARIQQGAHCIHCSIKVCPVIQEGGSREHGENVLHSAVRVFERILFIRVFAFYRPTLSDL